MGALALCLAAAALADEAVVEVLAVWNRPASDLVAVLAPLAGPDGSVAAIDTRLVVKATPSALAQIRTLLECLDVAPRALWISVRHASWSDVRSGTAGVTASVPTGATTVQVSPDGASVTTTTTNRRTRAVGAFGASGASETAADVQRLQCLEGRPAFIRVGRAEPAGVVSIVPGPGGPGTESRTGDAEADVGFWVVARLAGESVSLELASSRDAFDALGALEVRRVSSSVSGRPGEWIAVGGASVRRDARERGARSQSTASATSDWSVELRVDPADAP